MVPHGSTEQVHTVQPFDHYLKITLIIKNNTMNYIPKNGEFNLIGVQEIDSFSIEYKGITRKFVMFPEIHSTLQFTCEDNDCKQVTKEIDAQINKIKALHSATKSIAHESKYMPTYQREDNQKWFHEAAKDLVTVDEGVSDCVLISTYLMQLARHATTCTDIYVETPAYDRAPFVKKTDSFLKLVGALFGLCEKKINNRKLCAQTFPNARFHGLDYRNNDFPPNYEQVPKSLQGSDRELLLQSIVYAIGGRKSPYAGYGQALHDMIGKQFPKSNFTADAFIYTLMRTWDEVTKISTSNTSRSFRLSARMFDAYTILRVMNTTWSAHKTNEGPAGCRGKIPRNVILFAGRAHLEFCRGFLSRLDGLIMTNDFHKSRRSEELLHNPIPGPHKPNYCCLKIPYQQLPFLENMSLNDPYIFEHATNQQIMDYMEVYDYSHLDTSWWKNRNPGMADTYGFDPRMIFLITQPYLDPKGTPMYAMYPTHPRRLTFDAFRANDKAILGNMLVMQLVGPALRSIIPRGWRTTIDKDTTATNVVEAQVLQIATSKTPPELLHKMSRSHYESGIRWITRFTSTDPVSIRKYSTHTRRHDVLKGVSFLFLAGPAKNKNWGLWCGRLFITIATALQ